MITDFGLEAGGGGVGRHLDSVLWECLLLLGLAWQVDCVGIMCFGGVCIFILTLAQQFVQELNDIKSLCFVSVCIYSLILALQFDEELNDIESLWDNGRETSHLGLIELDSLKVSDCRQTKNAFHCDLGLIVLYFFKETGLRRTSIFVHGALEVIVLNHEWPCIKVLSSLRSSEC